MVYEIFRVGGNDESFNLVYKECRKKTNTNKYENILQINILDEYKEPIITTH